MFNKIIKSCNILKEVYSDSLAYAESVIGREDTEIYINSSSEELSRLLKKYGTLRFFMNHEDDYIVWDAMGAFHNDVVMSPNISKEITSKFDKYDLRGQISLGGGFHASHIVDYVKGAYLYVVQAGRFYAPLFNKFKEQSELGTTEFMIEEFKKSKLYKNLERIGLDKVELGSSF